MCPHSVRVRTHGEQARHPRSTRGHSSGDRGREGSGQGANGALGFGRQGLGVDAEAEHHSALVVFGDVAVRHPETGVGHVEEDVDGFAGAHEDGVFPDEIRLDGRRGS